MSRTPPPAPLDELARLAALGLRVAELMHELRQPVCAIKGSLQVQVAQGAPLPMAQIQELLSQMVHIERIVDLVGWTGRRPRFDVQPLALLPIASAVVDALQPRARALGTSLVIEPDAEQMAMADAVVVYQAIYNLVVNALDVARSRVSVRVAAGVIEVVDDGPGVHPAIVDRLFEPFVTTKPVGEGTGLGLSLSRRQLDAVGGSLELRSTSEQGSCFVMRVRLPSGA